MDPTNPDTMTFAGGLTGLLTFLIGAVVRAYIKDRREHRERESRIFETCVKSAYNAVANRIKNGEEIASKPDAGLVELEKFMHLRLRRPCSQEERELALLEFDALHGEHCPGGAKKVPLDPT